MAAIFYKWLIISFFSLGMSGSHPYYVSVVEMRNSPGEHLLELTCRMFTDDLEGALKKEVRKPIFLIHPSNKEEASLQVGVYLGKHLKISINGRPQLFNYLGYEIKEDAVNAYLQLPFSGSLNEVRFTSTILYREHPEQTGIFHVVNGETRKSLRIVNPDSLALFRF
ncbi:MAG: hypothetical protein IT254_02795 [Chitinophagaceae bacterium]|nr:hypothetical protein [Bacteroidota bacterium]MCC6257226.1 hypothetical protein [Chitinophagaceae bacterium]MCW5918088.1 hypothetical protein [Ferruginibacter sp.]